MFLFWATVLGAVSNAIEDFLEFPKRKSRSEINQLDRQDNHDHSDVWFFRMYAPSGNQILIVDDDDDACFLLVNLLQLEGFEAYAVRNDTEALIAITEENFDLVILDNRFPPFEGYDQCRRIRGRDPRIPIVFYSASDLPHHRKVGRAAGANAYVAKSDIDELIRTIRRMLGNLN